MDYDQGFKWFVDNIYSIHPFGDEEFAYNRLNILITSKERFATGELITLEEIRDRFKAYVLSLQQHQNGKYTKREHRIITIDNWITEKLYDKKLFVAKDPADFYFFGNMLDE